MLVVGIVMRQVVRIAAVSIGVVLRLHLLLLPATKIPVDLIYGRVMMWVLMMRVMVMTFEVHRLVTIVVDTFRRATKMGRERWQRGHHFGRLTTNVVC